MKLLFVSAGGFGGYLDRGLFAFDAIVIAKGAITIGVWAEPKATVFTSVFVKEDSVGDGIDMNNSGWH